MIGSCFFVYQCKRRLMGTFLVGWFLIVAQIKINFFFSVFLTKKSQKNNYKFVRLEHAKMILLLNEIPIK
jgi:hypothetical protein